jgi:hypothetical protein
MSPDAFHAELKKEVARVFALHRQLPDHHEAAPWATGSLDNPCARVWFVAEYPSLAQVERVSRFETAEIQWNKSKGDEAFRDMLVRHGFKRGGRNAPGGWHCYITNIVKSVARPAKWKKRSTLEPRPTRGRALAGPFARGPAGA